MATFLVTTNSDVIDENDGLLSLREAIIEANSTAEDDTIELSAEETYKKRKTLL